MIRNIGVIPYDRKVKEAFAQGSMAEEWASSYRMLFDRQDLEYARNQPGYHYHEWLTAVESVVLCNFGGAGLQKKATALRLVVDECDDSQPRRERRWPKSKLASNGTRSNG